MSKHLLIPLVILTLNMVPDYMYVTFASRGVIYITALPDEPCPAKPCVTLSQLSANPMEYLRYNMTMIFLQGKQS